MAEEKKPKIDLKARLGKGAAPPSQTSAGGIPVPAISSSGAVPAPSPSGSLPPPGVPVGPPPSFGSSVKIDPSNPLAAAATPYRPSTPAPPPQPQRIEVDDMAVQQARKEAMKKGVVFGLVAAVATTAIGYFAGGAIEMGKGRQKSVGDAKSLAGDVATSSKQLQTIAEKVEAGRKSLLVDKKFPDGLARDLGGLNVDFDGNKLAGVRFSGFAQDTTAGLIEYITQVQTLNDRKTAIIGLLSRLQKPITEQLTAGQKTKIQYAVFFGKQDPSKNPFAMLAPLAQPIEAANPASIVIPNEFAAIDPFTRQNISAPKYTTGGLDKPSAVYVLPKSFDAACPSETAGAIAQLGSQLGRVLTDIRGEQAAPGGDVVTDTKPGLVDRADKLVKALERVR